MIMACDPSHQLFMDNYYLFFWYKVLHMMDSPGGSDGKESDCNEGDLGSIPVPGRSPGGGHGSPLQYSCLEDPHGQIPMGSQGVGHNWVMKHNTAPHIMYDVFDILASWDDGTSENSPCVIKCDCLEELLSIISIIRLENLTMESHGTLPWNFLIHTHPLTTPTHIHTKDTACLNACMREQTRKCVSLE